MKLDLLTAKTYQMSPAEKMRCEVADTILNALNKNGQCTGMAPLGFGNLITEGSYQTIYHKEYGYALMSMDTQRNTWMVDSGAKSLAEHLINTTMHLKGIVPDEYDFNNSDAVKECTKNMKIRCVGDIGFTLLLPKKKRLFPPEGDFILFGKTNDGNIASVLEYEYGFTKYSSSGSEDSLFIKL